MTRSENPIAAAEALASAARDLALASRRFEAPIDSYRVFGNMQSAFFDLHQSLGQLADFHERTRDRAATDRGDRAMGVRYADTAAARLRAAAAAFDQATNELMAAFAVNAQIAWQPATARDALAERETQIATDAVTATRGEAEPPSLTR